MLIVYCFMLYVLHNVIGLYFFYEFLSFQLKNIKILSNFIILLIFPTYFIKFTQ